MRLSKASSVDWVAALRNAGQKVDKTLSEHVHDLLFAAIVQGRIGPGQHLAEQHIADALGISRISVREAIRQLAADGFVIIYPNRGAFTVGFEPDDIEEIFSLRASLEVLAIRRAASNLRRADLAQLEDLIDEMRAIEGGTDRFAGANVDARFHARLMEISGHKRAHAAWRTISAQITMAVYSATTYYGDMEGLADRHVAVIDVLRSRNPDLAEQKIREHIIYGSHLLLEALGREHLLDRERTV